MQFTRRDMIIGSASLALAGCVTRPGMLGADTYRNEVVGYGPLQPDPAGILELPRGFSYRVVSRAGATMSDGLIVPGKMDGMGCFDLGDGKVALVRNHELTPGDVKIGPIGGKDVLTSRIDRAHVFDFGEDGEALPGGTTTLVYDIRARKLVREHLSLVGTVRNCAGGQTPWGSWLSCEESTLTRGQPHGWVFEVPARGEGLVAPVPLKAMGRFNHEAAAVDPATGIVYLTEDRDDGLFYRFLPDQPGRLAAGGRLQALGFVGGGTDSRNWDGERSFAPSDWRSARWIDLDAVESLEDDLRVRGHARGAVRFARGEGIHFGTGELYFTCTSGGAAKIGQIMRYVPSAAEGQAGEKDAPGRLQLFLESVDSKLIDFADNITIAPWNHLILCEDKYTLAPFNHLKGVTPDGRTYVIGRNVHTDRAELAGACFSPDGSTMFVNIYAPGMTLAITGPWARFDETPIRG